MKLLGISLDQTLLAEGPVIGESAWRQRRYAEALEHLWYVVYSPRRDGRAPRSLAENLEVFPTASLTRLTFPWDAYRIGRQIVKRHQVDVTITQDPFATGLAGYWLKRRFGIPLNVMIFSSFFDNPAWVSGGMEERLLHRLGKFIVRQADTIRVESAVERDVLVRLGIPAERIWIVPLLIDLSRFAAADGAAVRAAYPGRRLLFFAGRLAPEKNLGVLIQAVVQVRRRYPDALLLVAGDGPERASLERLAAVADPEAVRFLGVVPGGELPAYFAASELFALSSLYEGIPTVLIEAGAAGRPVVTTPTRNVGDVVLDGDTGYVVDGTPEAFAQRIGDLLEAPEVARAMGVRARDHVLRHFGPSRVFADLLAMWEATRRGGRREA